MTVSDGAGGYLTAVSALRNPSADGHGALVFFWHNQTFLGWDTNKETWNVTVRRGGTNAIEATYADYAPGDPACCPSLPPVTITYSWNGAGLAQNRAPPAGAIVGIDVTSG
ncbi:MAG: LppP/LprE family lipoprotein [Acidimicrobiales bacterium]